MENFQFPLLSYCLEAQIFLREVTPDVLTLCHGVVFKTYLFHTQSHVTLMTLHENFDTPGLKQAITQLRLRLGRPMFAASDFEHSGV